MHYSVKTTNFEMTPEVSTYLDTKLAALDKYITKDDESVKCDVELEQMTGHQTGDIFRTEINVSIGKNLLRAEATKESINAAIDVAKDEITKRVRREKGKRSALFRKGGDKIKKMLRFGR